jgi:hypothetical protein
VNYTNLSKDDLKNLNLTEAEAKRIDADLSSIKLKDSPCRECSDCSNFENGLPTTTCRICGHDYTRHI